MNEALIQAQHCAKFLRQHLLEALKDGSPLESLALMPLIGDATTLLFSVEAIAKAIDAQARESQPQRDPNLLYCTVDTEDAAGELLIGYDHTPGRPGVHTLPNGDPGFPDDPEEIEVCEVWCEGRCLQYEALSVELRGKIDKAIADDIERTTDMMRADAAEAAEWD